MRGTQFDHNFSSYLPPKYVTGNYRHTDNYHLWLLWAGNTMSCAYSHLQQCYTSGGSHLAVGRGQREVEASTNDNHHGSAELDAEPTRRRNLGNLHSDGGDNLVPEQRQAENDANPSNRQNQICLLYTSPSPRD